MRVLRTVSTVLLRLARHPVGTSVLLVPLLVAAFGASCSEGTRHDAAPATLRAPHLGHPPVRLVVVTDLEGYLSPCGCTSRPLGGIDKMAAKVRALEHGAPTLFVAAGDLFFDNESHDLPGSDTQELWKAQTVVDVWNHLGMAAATPGWLDLSQGPKAFADLVGRAHFPLLAAGLSVHVPAPADGGTGGVDAGTGSTHAGGSHGASGPTSGPSASPPPAPILRADIIRQVGGTKVGLFGISDMTGPGGQPPSGIVQEAAPLEAARATAADLHHRGAQIVVALVRGDRLLGRRIATQVPGVDFVVQGGIDRAEAMAPIAAGKAWIVHAGRQGQGILVLDLYPKHDKPFVDLSVWSRKVQRERLSAQADELRHRIAGWEKKGGVDQAAVQRQRERLHGMERQMAALAPVPSRDHDGAFTARWDELPPEAHGDPAVTHMLDAYFRRVNAHNARVFADRTRRPVPEGQPAYVGSQTCQSCHQAAYAWWKTTPHSHAYRTLAERHKQFNLDCVGCHVTAYERPGGATVTHNMQGALVNVGCEQCHGPGSQHVADPTVHMQRKDVPATVCVQCHNEQHSDLFDYSVYHQRLIAPGHGLPVPGAGGAHGS